MNVLAQFLVKRNLEKIFDDIVENAKPYDPVEDLFVYSLQLMSDILDFSEDGFKGNSPLTQIHHEIWSRFELYAMGFMDGVMSVGQSKDLKPSQAAYAYSLSNQCDEKWIPAHLLIVKYLKVIETCILTIVRQQNPTLTEFRNMLLEKCSPNEP